MIQPLTERVLLIASLLALVTPSLARDAGQWASVDPDVSAWYRELMQPDNPTVSCCGEADAYYADSFEVSGDQYVAIITDEREDRPLGRIPRAVGTRIVVPNYKMKIDADRPRGDFRGWHRAGSMLRCAWRGLNLRGAT